jgi:hypothetical protein
MDPNTLAQLNEAYQKGVYTSEESLEVDTELQEWVEALIEEGYDLDEYTDEEIYEAFISPYKGKTSHNNPQGHSPATKADLKSKKLQETEPGSVRQKNQTRRAGHLAKMFKAGRDTMREEVDLYDLVSEYLVSEGYCDSYEDADVIMANMSEEWREGILDEAKGTILSVKSPEGKEKPVLQRNSETSSQISKRRSSEQQRAKKEKSKNDRAYGRLSVARKKSIETMNAKPGEDEGEYDSGYYGDDDTTMGSRHYGLSRTSHSARRRRASGR